MRAEVEARIQALKQANQIHEANIKKNTELYNQVVNQLIGEENPEKASILQQTYMMLESMINRDAQWIEQANEFIAIEEQKL